MAFYELSYPINPCPGTISGAGFSSAMFETDSGQRRYVRRHLQSRTFLDLAQQIQSHDDLYALITFYRRIGGVANGFRCMDWWDYATNAKGRLWGPNNTEEVACTDQVLGVGDSSTTQFQLRKFYGDSDPIYTRTIKKPVAGTVLVGLNGVNQTSGWTLDTTTGIITFTSPPSAVDEISWGGEFDVPVHFDMTLDEMLAVTMDDYGNVSVPSVPMSEILDENPLDEFHHFGGAIAAAMTANVSVTQGNGRLHVLDPDANGRRAYLPPKAQMCEGMGLFTIVNASGTYYLDVYDYDTDTNLTSAHVLAGKSVIVHLGRHPTTQALTWYLFAE